MSSVTDADQDLPALNDEFLSESLRVLPEGIQIDTVPPLIQIKSAQRRPRSASAGVINHCTTPQFILSHSNPNRNKRTRYTTITQSKKELQDWIELILGIQFEYSFFEQLKRGTALCDLLNAIKPGTCSKHEKSERLYIQKRNVSIYLSGCRALGIPKNNCFAPNDLVSDYQLRSNQRKIISNLRHVVRTANKLQLQATPSETNDVYDGFDEHDDDELQVIVVDTPEPKSKSIRKFKLKDYSISITGTPSEISDSQSNGLPSVWSPRETMFHFSNVTYLDTQSYRSKELLLSGYFRNYGHIDTSIIKTICLFVMGDVASVYWTLYSQNVDDFLVEEEDIFQYEKQLVIGNGSVVLEIAISHHDGVLTFSIENVNRVQLIACCYCECMNSKRIIKHVYNSMNGVYNMDMDLMDITAWKEQNALAFKKRFIELNNDTQKSAKYYRIPHFNETLKLRFHMEIVSAFNNVNMNKRSEYKWRCIDEVTSDDLFEDFEMYSSTFGDENIEYDKCWALVAKYSDFYEQFYFALKLLKLPSKLATLSVKCCLTVDGESYTKTQEMDLNKHCCEWDHVRIDTNSIHQKTVHISIEITEAADFEGNWIRKSDWINYGIK